MTYKELKEKYPSGFVAAAVNCRNQGRKIPKLDHCISTCSSTNGGFIWIRTKEGHNFWEKLCDGKIQNCIELQPNLMKTNESKASKVSCRFVIIDWSRNEEVYKILALTN
jgi:hypothetical protein